jgi:hypothetical protein
VILLKKEVQGSIKKIKINKKKDNKKHVATRAKDVDKSLKLS